MNKLFPHPKKLSTQKASSSQKALKTTTTTNELQQPSLPPKKLSTRPHTRLNPLLRQKKALPTLIITHGAPPPCSASLSAGTPLLGVPFPPRPIGPADTPSTRQSDGGAWRAAREIIPQKQAPTFFESAAQGDADDGVHLHGRFLLGFGGNSRRTRTMAVPCRAGVEIVSTRCSLVVVVL